VLYIINEDRRQKSEDRRKKTEDGCHDNYPEYRKYLEKNTGAKDVSLTTSHLKDIETLLKRFPDIGPRQSDNFAKQLD